MSADKPKNILRPDEYFRLYPSLLAAMEERSERFSLCAGFGTGDLVAGLFRGKVIW